MDFAPTAIPQFGTLRSGTARYPSEERAAHCRKLQAFARRFHEAHPDALDPRRPPAWRGARHPEGDPVQRPADGLSANREADSPRVFEDPGTAFCQLRT